MKVNKMKLSAKIMTTKLSTNITQSRNTENKRICTFSGEHWLWIRTSVTKMVMNTKMAKQMRETKPLKEKIQRAADDDEVMVGRNEWETVN
mmetsp:Transcript_73549/g.117250  ORF Transcript_73549/g.117250 Transcript_73549/m.117250 type:complete len:91 (-) Transcript_73549:333-605(-)